MRRCCLYPSVGVCVPAERALSNEGPIQSHRERESVGSIIEREKTRRAPSLKQVGERGIALFDALKNAKGNRYVLQDVLLSTTDCENADRNASAAIAARRKRVVRAIDPHQSLPFPSPRPSLPPLSIHPSNRPDCCVTALLRERLGQPATIGG